MDSSVAITLLAPLLVLVVFANRFFVGLLLKQWRGERFEEKRTDYEPTVSIIIPMFNEGKGIYDTIRSLVRLDYPKDKLEIVIVDDCSTDDSYQWALRGAEGHDNVRVLQNPQNMGKRRSINRAVRMVDSEIVVSVDSDVVVDRRAVRALVCRFTRPEIAAVGGRVNVLNRDENWLTRMQAIKYFYGYEYLKNIERAFHSVLCLSGCLTAYRREVLLELEPILEIRNVFGIPIKYGEDRFLTRQIIKAGYKTTMTLDAISYTRAPSTLSAYFAQQLRWRRSNIIDYVGGMSHVWKLHPLVAIHYFSLFALLMIYPLLILDELLSGYFFSAGVLHALILAFLGMVYRFHVRHLPEEEKVSPFYFMAMTFVMPITYLVLTPLALFTLDSGSWETRGHTEAPGLEAEEPEPLPARPATARAEALSAIGQGVSAALALRSSLR